MWKENLVPTIGDNAKIIFFAPYYWKYDAIQIFEANIFLRVQYVYIQDCARKSRFTSNFR